MADIDTAGAAAATGGAIEADAVIIGAGPAGLFQAFELGLLGIKCHIVDTLKHPGGQCAELYPDKPIYDIPALPVCGAQELVDRLLEQIKPFDPQFHLGEEVVELQAREDGRFDLATAAGTRFVARTVVIAAGLGSFQPRRLGVEGADAFEDRQIHYRVRNAVRFPRPAAGDLRRRRLRARLGDRPDRQGDEHRARASPARVPRRAGLGRAHAGTRGRGPHELRRGHRRGHSQSRTAGSRASRSSAATARWPDLEADHVLAFFGLHPKLGPIAEWGFELEKKAIKVDTAKFQTSVPGIFAIGDINTYPGKKKLILSGFHEAALAAFAIAEHLNPAKKVHLQYTTTSPIMQKRLGVNA